VDKIVVTALLIVVGIISVVSLFNALYPLITQSTEAMASMERRADDRLKTQVQILHAAPAGSDLYLWVKNVGASRILGVESSDVFFGPQGNYARIGFGAGTPNWQYVIESGGTDWNPTATIKIIIYGYGAPAPGRYFAKIVLPNGISDETFFSW